MNELVQRFMDRPLWQRVCIWAGSLLFVILIFWQYFYSPRLEEHIKLTEKVENLDSRIVDERRRARNLKKLREKVRELDVKLKFALQELPDKKEIPDLLSSISTLAKDAGLDVTVFKPQGENTKEFYAEVPVNISVEGTYHQVATFFDEVGQLSRIVNINDVALREPRLMESRMVVKTDCVATTFRYLDEAERQKSEESAEGSGKRRRRG